MLYNWKALTEFKPTPPILLLTLNLILTFQLHNYTTRKISQRHSLYQVWTFWNHSFLSYASTVSVKTFQPQNMSLLAFPKVIPCTKFEHFRIIHFWVRQTDRQTHVKASINVKKAGIHLLHINTHLLHIKVTLRRILTYTFFGLSWKYNN